MIIEDGIILSSNIPKPKNDLEIALGIHGLEDLSEDFQDIYNNEKLKDWDKKPSVEILAYYLLNGFHESAVQIVTEYEYPNHIKERIYSIKLRSKVW